MILCIIDYLEFKKKIAKQYIKIIQMKQIKILLVIYPNIKYLLLYIVLLAML